MSKSLVRMSEYEQGKAEGVRQTKVAAEIQVALNTIDAIKEVLNTYIAVAGFIATPGLSPELWRTQFSGIDELPDFDEILNNTVEGLRDAAKEYAGLARLENLKDYLAQAAEIRDGITALLNYEDNGEKLTAALIKHGSDAYMRKRQAVESLIAQMQSEQAPIDENRIQEAVIEQHKQNRAVNLGRAVAMHRLEEIEKLPGFNRQHVKAADRYLNVMTTHAKAGTAIRENDQAAINWLRNKKDPAKSKTPFSEHVGELFKDRTQKKLLPIPVGDLEAIDFSSWDE